MNPTDIGSARTRVPVAVRAILVVAGLVVVGIGGAILTAPGAFHAGNGIEYAGNSSLLSETRAAGGALLATGVLVTLGAFVRRLTFTASLIGAVVYLAYGLARLLSVAVDGLPADSLVAAAVAELILGVACGYALHRTVRGPVPPATRPPGRLVPDAARPGRTG
ncbi:DUF4345 domain-containing protein [Micromonospora sp. NBC_01813]|uniref:DUF4345 domain-containing protein n=1 Tax=Micromonospora sp. NBC_01813 TaxID=2975988 RepID=UPI002DDC6D35|nr:DUF4345 domain-containing protein [Micromonospora sp. NBC_01813]WSA06222.1 DUF4345 domain-containing protein [Micromonospora sp. NBC_01813]